MEREHGPAGRFGLSLYVIGPVHGLLVVPSPAGQPCVVSPPMDKPAVGEGNRGLSEVDERDLDSRGVVQQRVDAPHAGEPPPPPIPQCPQQETLDLGTALRSAR
jgi:hypothetical protein